MKAATKARPERRKAASAKPLPLAAPQTAPALALGHRHRSLLLPTLEALHLLAKVQRACASGAATLNRQEGEESEGPAPGPEGLGHVRHMFSEISESLLYLGDELGDIARQLTGEPHRATPLRHALALQDLLTAQRSADFRSQCESDALRRALEAFAPPAP